MRPVGKHIAGMLANLTTVGLDPKKLELLGLSLGGVSMTFVAKNFQQITGRNISKLTALDPTGPCVRHLGPKDRLDPSDADFVLHIATNIGGYGIGTPVGHVSVYVNGGEYQLGALPSYLCDNLCSHIQAFLIWISVMENPGKFIMMQCDSQQQARDHNCFERKPMVTNTLDLYTDRNKPEQVIKEQNMLKMEKTLESINKVICVVVVIQLMCTLVTAVEYNETNEGYAQNFLPICPGAKKPAEIKPEHLSKLKIAVFAGGTLMYSKWTSYNYRNIKTLAMDPNIDFRRKTIVYCPGYMEYTALPVGRLLMLKYKNMGYNALTLEYVDFTSNIFPVVARVMRPVGKHIAGMLANLTAVGLDPKKLELLGVSLGGLSMTFVAKNFQQITGRNISKLTALDPSGPCVRHLGPKDRLDPSDADFVLHIATNIGGYGLGTPVGHVSVYVNGGEYQPGALPSYLCDNLCSHMQAFLIWISVMENPGKFIMMQCDSQQQARDHKCSKRKPMVKHSLDLYTDRNKPGIYYLATSSKYPYYLGKKGLKRSGSEFLNHISDLNVVDILRV
ncbi:pancreatic lipase-related protein 2-like [Cydia strobilella]|uniref:pancreatic lipase-related protein 2-like n=1 Tax=Cydia strobilella TaxID=1100964 RepID=UPI0030079AEF